MACSLSHYDDEVEALVQKLIDEDMVRQKAILDLALQFDNACTTKDDLRKAYEKCNDISQESRALIDAFLKKRSDDEDPDQAFPSYLDVNRYNYPSLASYYYNTTVYVHVPRAVVKLSCRWSYEQALSGVTPIPCLYLLREAWIVIRKFLWIDSRRRFNQVVRHHRPGTRFEHVQGGSSSQTHELCDVYLTEKKLHQLHLDEEVLRETLEEQARDKKEREEKIRQKQAEDEEFMLEFGVKYDSEYDTRVEPSPSTPNPVRIIPGPAGIVQQAKLLKENVFILDLDGALMSTQEYMQKVVEDVGEDDDFKSGSWVSATNYVNANGGTVTGLIMKDLSGTIPGIIHYKVLGDGGYENDITVGAALILVNVSVFTLKPSMHYLNITMRNVVKVFRKDTVPESDSG
ncbi:protein phosphatase [Tanacetum coccineum]